MVIAIFLIIYLIVSWFRPKFGLALLLAILPSYQIKFQIFNIPFTFLEAMILGLFLVFLIQNAKDIFKNKEKVLANWSFPIFIFLIIATGAMFLSPDLKAGAGVWRAYFIEPILFLLTFCGLVKSKKDLKIIGLGAAISVIYLSFFAFFQKFVGQGIWSEEVWAGKQIFRVSSLYPHPNFLGLFLGPMIFLGLGAILHFIKNKKTAFVLGILFFLLSFLALIFAMSEGAIIGVLTGLIVWILSFKKFRKKITVGLVILIILIFLFPASRAYFLEKALLQDLSGQLRINIWRGASELIKTSPLIGVGLDGYEKLISDFQINFYETAQGEKVFVFPQPYPHNLFLTLWLELGFLGLLVFIWLIIKFFLIGIKLFKKEPILIGSLMAAMIAILTHGLVDTPYFKNDLAIVFWLIIGVEIILNKLSKKDYGREVLGK